MADPNAIKWVPTPQNLKYFAEVQEHPEDGWRKRFLVSKTSLNEGLRVTPSAIGFGPGTGHGPSRIIHSCSAIWTSNQSDWYHAGPNSAVPYPYPEEWEEADREDGVVWSEWMPIEQRYYPEKNDDDGCGVGITDLE